MLIAILALVALYRLPDFVAGVMANPFYIDLGFSKVDIANVSKLYGVWVGMIGAFAGGIAVAKIGLRMTLLLGASSAPDRTSCSPGSPWKGRSCPSSSPRSASTTSPASFAGSALIAYMSGLTAPGFAATQYALLSSLYALPGKLVGGVSGFIVQAHGYATFFTMTAAVGIPVVLLCLFLWPYTAEAEAEDEKAETGVGLQPPAPAPAR